jgi:hypothetical protein
VACVGFAVVAAWLLIAVVPELVGDGDAEKNDDSLYVYGGEYYPANGGVVERRPKCGRFRKALVPFLVVMVMLWLLVKGAAGQCHAGIGDTGMSCASGATVIRHQTNGPEATAMSTCTALALWEVDDKLTNVTNLTAGSGIESAPKDVWVPADAGVGSLGVSVFKAFGIVALALAPCLVFPWLVGMATATPLQEAHFNTTALPDTFMNRTYSGLCPAGDVNCQDSESAATIDMSLVRGLWSMLPFMMLILSLYFWVPETATQGQNGQASDEIDSDTNTSAAIMPEAEDEVVNETGSDDDDKPLFPQGLFTAGATTLMALWLVVLWGWFH